MITSILLAVAILLSPTITDNSSSADSSPGITECISEDPDPEIQTMYFDPCADLDTSNIEWHYKKGYAK